MARLALSNVILVLYVAGLIATLFGPAPGRFLGAVAFLLIIAVSCVTGEQHKQAHPFFKAGGISGRYPAVRRLRPVLRTAMLGCLISVVASFILIIPSWRLGVTDGTSPVFAERAVYRLNAHGVETVVTRTQYLIAGSSFMVVWHTVGMLIDLLWMHLILFGDWPRGWSPAGRKGMKPPLESELL
jgi:hypothetical protein